MNRHERRKYKKVHGLEINNKEANAEHEAMNELVRRDHDKLLEVNKKHQELISCQEPNWALFNYVIGLVSFESCKSNMSALHILWRHIWPHFNKVCLENDLLKTYLLSGKKPPEDILELLRNSKNPEQIAVETLNIISELAKKRAKLKSYQVALQKDNNIKSLESV